MWVNPQEQASLKKLHLIIRMPAQYTDMGVEELIGKMLGGERHFPGMRLVVRANFTCHPRYEELERYLKQHQDLSREPLDLERSSFLCVQAIGLYLPYAHLANADFRGAYLQGANFVGADLTRTDLSDAKLSGSNIREANFARTQLLETDFTGVTGLSEALHLNMANFYRTRFSKKEIGR